MKRILLVCCLMLGLTAAAFAQAPAPVSRPDFVAKVAQLNTLLNAGNVAAATTKWQEISLMINDEMKVYNYQTQQAAAAHNEADKTHYVQLTVAQRKLYGETLQLKNADMLANKAVINTKLSTFAEGMI